MGEEGNEEEKWQLDSLLKRLGGFGKFQVCNLLVICSMILLCSFSEQGYVLTASEVRHRCLISECESRDSGWDDSGKPWLSAAIPTTSSGAYDSCLRYNNTLSQCTNGSFSRDTYQCNAFVYETEEWTIAREDWGIHCHSDRFFLSLVGSLNNAGGMIGAIYAGYLLDRYGRKMVIVTSSVAIALLGLLKTLSVSYMMMVAVETLEAVLSAALYSGGLVLALEITHPSKRVLAGILISFTYPVGEMVLGVVQFLTLEWRTTIRILYAPFVLVVVYYWIVPESVRWLLDSQQPDEAVAVLRWIAKANGRPLSEDVVQRILTQETAKNQVRNEEVQTSMYVQLWRSKRMRLRLVANHFVRICLFFLFYGMIINSVSVNNNKFLNFILTGMIEIPASFLTYLILDRLGRRIVQSSALGLCASACFLYAYIPNDGSWSSARLFLYLTGKFGVTISLTVSDMYTTEMFPTSIRSTVMSTSLVLGKLAVILAPEVPLLSDIYEPLPLLLFGVLATAAAFVTMTCPETLNCKLPDTMEEAEHLGQKTQNGTSENPLLSQFSTNRMQAT